jgi:SAM-dependent methyltransferase
MTERRLTFGSVASSYERHRPGYPDELVDRVLGYAGRPVATALEIGAGTGKATRAFAARGVAVTATDPDPEMLAELRRHVPDTVTVVRGSLEELDLTGPFDLVYAAAALHWTDPETRWSRVAALLPAGGTFASFGGPTGVADPELEERIRVVQQPYVADENVPSPDGTSPDAPMLWPGTELEASPLFTDVEQTVLVRRFQMPADDYVAHIGTVSAYLLLLPARRTEVLRLIREVLPDPVEVAADLTLHLAHRAGG